MRSAALPAVCFSVRVFTCKTVRSTAKAGDRPSAKFKRESKLNSKPALVEVALSLRNGLVSQIQSMLKRARKLVN